MSDSSIVQSSGSTASPETSPHEHLIFSTTAARVQASHGLRPSISRNSQDTESTRVDPTHTIASGSSTAGEEEIQPCLIATPSLPGSSQDKEPSQRKPARNIVDNLGSSSLALATGLLPIYFLLFAALAFYKNNAVLESGSQAEWLLVAAKYGPSVFPIMFAAIMGQFMTVIAAWKLEQSITIGLLEYLLSSRSLGSAFLSLMKLRIFNTWVPLVLSVWCLSPLGGQASLRAVYSDVSSIKSTMEFHHLDNNHTSPINIYSSSAARFNPAINALFVTALASSNSSKLGSQDMYGNLRLPMLEAITSELATDTWYDLRDRDVPAHAALLGIPFIGAPSNANSSFNVQTSYTFCSCSVTVESFDEPRSRWNVSALTAVGPNTTTMTYGQEYPSIGPRLRDINVARQWNDTTPRVIGLQSLTTGATPQLLTEAWCNLSTTYIEAQVLCSGGPQNCTTISVRKAPHQPWPETATILDCIWGESCHGSAARGLAASVFRSLMGVIPPAGMGILTPLEQYFHTPGAPFLPPNDDLAIGKIGDKLFSQRLTQLLNTYLLACSAPYAISGNFSFPTEGGTYSPGHSIATFPSSSFHGVSSYGIQTTEGQVERSQVVLRCHVLWTIVLIAVSSLLIATGISTAILDSRRKGPQVLDDFTSSLRYNPYASIEQKNSIEDGIDIARRSRHVRIQLGDVRPHDEVGLVAVATMGDDEGQTVERLRRRRLYA